MSGDDDDLQRVGERTWTVRYKIPLAVVTGLLAGCCFVGLFAGTSAGAWVGGSGLVVLVVWVVVFRVLYRRGF